jgi:hypothetical protein
VLAGSQIETPLQSNDTVTSLSQLKNAQFVIKANAFSFHKANASQAQSMGFEWDDMVISCLYNNYACRTLDFVYFWDFNYGNCWTFNKEKKTSGSVLKKTGRVGPHNGLTMELFVGFPCKFNLKKK